jgi:hypothetical protein
MDASFEAAVDRVRSAMGAPSLPRSQKGTGGPDPKWLIGDALLAVPVEHRDAVGEAAGLERGEARSYARVAEMWPPSARRKAAWSVHRELTIKSKIYDPADRFETIRDGMKVREAHLLATGKEVDRQAFHVMSDETVIAEMARLLLSPRQQTVLPRLYEALNELADGRRIGRARRSTAALRRLDKEIREAQREIKKRRDHGSGGVRFYEVMKRLLNTAANVEEADLLWDNDRTEVDEDDWVRLGKQLEGMGKRAIHVAGRILMHTNVDDTEGWDEDTRLALGFGGEDDIVDAELVDED